MVTKYHGQDLIGLCYLEYFYYCSVEDSMQSTIKYVAETPLELVMFCVNRQYPLLKDNEEAMQGFRIRTPQ